ncbi:MAG: hypothetical protein OHK0050_45050 [Roseiflexaceae bacterium]
MVAAVVAVLIAITATWSAWVGGAAARLDVGAATDEVAVQGFFDRERTGNETYRWGKEDPQLTISAVPGPAVLMLRMAGRPEGVEVAIQGVPQPPAPFAVKALELRRYALLVSPPADGSDLTITIAASAEAIPPEPRRLSVLVESIRLEPLRIAAVTPPAIVLLQFGWFGLMLFTLLWLITRRDWAGLLGAVVITVALAWAWGSMRAAVAPHVLSVVVGATALALLIGLLWIGARAAEQVDAATLLAGLVAASSIIPAWRSIDYLRDGQHLFGLLALAILPGGILALLLRDRWRLVPIVWGILAAIGYAGVQINALMADAPGLRSDFHALLRGAARLAYGTLPLYNLTVLDRNPFGNSFAAPPLVALLFQPLAVLPLADALRSWRIFSVLLLIPTIWLFFQAYQVPRMAWPRLGMLLLIASAPLVSTLLDGQLGFVLLLCGALAFWGLAMPPQAWRELVGGVGLGALVALSPSWLPLLLVPLLRGCWRLLMGAVISLSLLSLIAGLWVGPTQWLTYMLGVLPNLVVSTGWIENQSLAGFVNRLYEINRLALQPGVGGFVPTLWIGLSVAVAGLTLWLTRPGGRVRGDVTMALWIVALLLALPSAWIHWQILLVVVMGMVLVACHGDCEVYFLPETTRVLGGHDAQDLSRDVER